MKCIKCILKSLTNGLKSLFANRQDILSEEYGKIATRWPDISKHNISYLVRENEGQFIVFLDKELDVDWILSNTYEKQKVDNEDKRNQILSRVEILQHQPIVRYINKSMKKDFNCMLAEAYVYALENQFDMAKGCISNAEEYISNRNFELSRKWHLSYSMLFLCAFLLIVIIIKAKLAFISTLLSISSDSLNKLLYSFFGAVGATLSIIQKTGKRNYNCESGRLLHALEAFSRLIAGIISSIVIIYMVELDLVFSGFKSADKFNASIIIVSIIAGFSERLVPSIISKFESSEMKGVKFDDKKSTANI